MSKKIYFSITNDFNCPTEIKIEHYYCKYQLKLFETRKVVSLKSYDYLTGLGTKPSILGYFIGYLINYKISE